MNESVENSIVEKSIITVSSTTRRTIRVFPVSKSISISTSESEICRICLDTDSTQVRFIHPCKCSGTMKFVHEECLKTWLVSRNAELAGSICELCSTKYLMKFSIKRKCKPKEAFTTGAAHCLFIPILVAVKVMLFIIVYLLADRYLNSNSTTEQKAYTIALTITCLIAEGIIIALMVNSFKEACYASSMHEWHILDQDFEERQIISQEKIEEFTEARGKNLKLPKKLKVEGMNVRLPALKPLLTPVFRSGRIVEFSPKYLTPNHQKDKTSIHELNDSELKD